MSTSLALDGVFAPATTTFSPDTGELDLDGMRKNAGDWLDTALGGLVLFGSTGEGLLLADDERVRVLEAIRADHSSSVLLAGTGAESTRRAIELSRSAARAGADAVLVHPPAYYRPQMSPEVLRSHFTAVADASPVPLVLYQVPSAYSGIQLHADLVAGLSDHPNIIGIKDSSGDVDALRELVRTCAPSFQVLVGNGAALLDALEAGATGGILGVAVLAPADSIKVHTLFRSGDGVRSRATQDRITAVHREIVAARGVPGVKAALDLLGMVGGPPRPPLQPLPSGEMESVRATLVTAGLLDRSGARP
ncbi:MAG TPA: dihydrodipicolinate synthase family protein [Longimicrobiaceae bacterium]|nr:dihydrodipicolinate synthase family protein [Longimicrobiaceae bacterium]